MSRTKGESGRTGFRTKATRALHSFGIPAAFLALAYWFVLMVFAGRIAGPQQWFWDLGWPFTGINSIWSVPAALALGIATTPAIRRVNRWASGHLLRSIIVMTIIVGAAGLFAALVLGWTLKHTWFWQIGTGPITAIDVIKLAGAFAAGVGGIVALVVAYHRQQVIQHDDQRAEQAHFTERYMKAAEMLGSDSVAIRLAGITTLTRIADENPGSGRQQCIDLLTGYVRTAPFNQGTPDDRALRSSIFSAIGERLAHDAKDCESHHCWHGHTFDLREVTFYELTIAGWVLLPATSVNLSGATFRTHFAHLNGFKLSGGKLSLLRVAIRGGDGLPGHLDLGYSELRAGRLEVSLRQNGGRLVSLLGALLDGADVLIDLGPECPAGLNIALAIVLRGVLRVQLGAKADGLRMGNMIVYGGDLRVWLAPSYVGTVDLTGAELRGGRLTFDVMKNHLGEIPLTSAAHDKFTASGAKTSATFDLFLGPYRTLVQAFPYQWDCAGPSHRYSLRSRTIAGRHIPLPHDPRLTSVLRDKHRPAAPAAPRDSADPAGR